ncbi:HAD-IA family hydrolase [Lysobacter claricitrinus]|uniref:HAD-IA family hydrolase n=1 Tax=Lysobacter claricitrinus TaxID=3367728 RepID=UPI0037DB6415
MSSTPSLVLFDLDGVLVDYDRAARVTHLARAIGVEDGAVWAALFGSGLEDRFDAGSIEADDYLDALGGALGTSVNRAVWADARRVAMRMDPALPALLARVHARCDIAVLTNNGGLLVDLLREIAPALAAAFGDRVLCSARLGARKLVECVYLDAVESLGHAPASTLFVDDSIANVEGARRAGLQAAHVAAPNVLAGVLAAYGLG